MPAIELFADAPQTTITSGPSSLSAPAQGTVETWVPASTAAFPAASSGAGTQFHVVDQAAPSETIAVTNISGGNWTVTRGAEGTTPVPHAAGCLVVQVITPGWLTSVSQGSASVIDAAQYGAVGDGATDNATALAAWAAAINANPGGAIARLAPGNYLTSAPLPAITANGAVISGAGWTQSAVSGTGGSCITAKAGYTGGALLTLAGEGIQCDGFALNGATVAGATPLAAVQAQNCQFENVYFHSPKVPAIATPAFPGATATPVTNSTAVPVLVSVTGGTVTSVQVTVPAGSALTMPNAPGATFLVPSGGVITVNWSAAPSGWTWTGVACCLDIQHGGATTWAGNSRFAALNYPSASVMVNDTDLIMTGCKPLSSTWNVVLLAGASGAIIEASHLTPGVNGQNCIWIPGSASHINIAGNRFDNFTYSAVQISSSSAPPNDISISGNDFFSGNVAQTAPSGASGFTGFAMVGVDTAAGGVRNLKILGNNGWGQSGSLAAWGVSCQAQNGSDPGSGSYSRLAGLGASVCFNDFYVATGFYANGLPSKSFGNSVTTTSTGAPAQTGDIYTAGTIFYPPSGDTTGVKDPAAWQANANAGLITTLQPNATYYAKTPTVFPPGTGLVCEGKSMAYFAGSQPMPLGGAVIEVVPGFAGITVGPSGHTQAVNAPIVLVSPVLGSYTMPAPAAPALTTGTTSSGMTAGVYQVQVTFVVVAGGTVTGETLPSAATTATVAANGTLTIASPIPTGLATGATSWFAYVTQPGGSSFTRQQGATTPTALGSNLTLSSTPTSSGAAPPSSSTAQPGAANQMFRGITIDGRPVPGNTVNGIEAWGPVWAVTLQNVGVYGMPHYGLAANSSAGDGTGKFPDFWQILSSHFAGNGSDGLNAASMSDTYVLASESTGNIGNGWNFQGGDNIKIVGSKAEYNTLSGLVISRGSSSRPVLISGFGTDGNAQHGISISGSGDGPVVLTGVGLNFDGNSASGTFAGLFVAGNAHVTATGLHVTTATRSPGGVKPSYGILPGASGSNFNGLLQLDQVEVYGATAGIGPVTGTGTVQYGPNVAMGTGDWTTGSLVPSWATMTAPGGIDINTIGAGLMIAEGTNAKMGVVTLTAGSAVVPTTAVAANSRIYLTSQADGGTPGFLRVSTRTAGTSFTITSSSGTDTSTVGWLILDPG